MLELMLCSALTVFPIFCTGGSSRANGSGGRSRFFRYGMSFDGDHLMPDPDDFADNDDLLFPSIDIECRFLLPDDLNFAGDQWPGFGGLREVS